MSDLRNLSKAFMEEFIELYKSFPSLWKTKSSEYKNRNLKDSAYKVLLKKLQEIEPNATKKSVTAKINSIRGSFRREMKKIQASKRSGTAADDIYETHLWYYDLLLFTRDQEMPRGSVSNVIEDEEGESGSEQESDNEGEKTQDIEHVDDDVESVKSPPTSCMSRSSSTNQQISSPSTSSASKSSTKKRKTNKVDEQADEVLSMVSERLRNNNTTKNDDAFDIFGKHVAAKLRTLPKLSKLYTEKLITDLLFEAEMGNINKNTKIATLPNTPGNLTETANNYVNDGNYYNNPYQHRVYQNLESVSATSQFDTSTASNFFGSYQPTDGNN